MTRHIAVYTGTIGLLFAAGTPAFCESVSSRTMSSDSRIPMEPDRSVETELTDGQAANSEHADSSVSQGKLEEVQDSKYLNATVYDSNGQEIGKIQQVLKDTSGGEVEYTVFISKESKL
jgi:hypothetical protein